MPSPNAGRRSPRQATTWSGRISVNRRGYSASSPIEAALAQGIGRWQIDIVRRPGFARPSDGGSPSQAAAERGIPSVVASSPAGTISSSVKPSPNRSNSDEPSGSQPCGARPPGTEVG